MNARTTSPLKAQLHLATGPFQIPYADYTADIQDLFSLAMDQALGVQEASLAAIVKMQSDAFELQRQACEQGPELGELRESASGALAYCMELQMKWLNLMAAFASQCMSSWFQFATLGAHASGIGSVIPMKPIGETAAPKIAPVQVGAA